MDNMKKAVFLDRDGTINPGFNINKSSEFSLYPFVVPALKKFKKAGYLIIIVTNQGGVGLGFMSETDLHLIHKKMEDILKKEGIFIDKIYSSFYHKDSKNEKYLKNSTWRKPDTGMILQAAKDFNINLKNSWMIGDRPGDIEAGEKSGCKTILVKSGNGQKTVKEFDSLKFSPTMICEDLLEAADKICGGNLK